MERLKLLPSTAQLEFRYQLFYQNRVILQSLAHILSNEFSPNLLSFRVFIE